MTSWDTVTSSLRDYSERYTKTRGNHLFPLGSRDDAGLCHISSKSFWRRAAAGDRLVWRLPRSLVALKTANIFGDGTKDGARESAEAGAVEVLDEVGDSAADGSALLGLPVATARGVPGGAVAPEGNVGAGGVVRKDSVAKSCAVYTCSSEGEPVLSNCAFGGVACRGVLSLSARTLGGDEVSEVSEGSWFGSGHCATPAERKGALTASGSISF